MTAFLVLLLACPAAFAPVAIPASARTDGFEAERTAAVHELLDGLERYAEWCTTKKIWVERNRALEAILAIDPNNMSAKRGLGWQQVADGVWEPPKEPKPAKNFDPAAVKEAPARLAAAIQPWREHVIRLLEEHKSEVTAVQRESVYAELLALDPEDAFAREARGEAKSDKGWVLAETVRAKARRAEIRALVKDSLAAVPAVADVTPTANDLAYKVTWKFGVGTDRVRVMTTGERDEAVRVASVLHAARDVFNRVFGTAGDLGGSFDVYLLCDGATKATFLENIAGITPSRRAFYDKVDGSGLIGSNGAAWWAPTKERRLDGLTRHEFGALFQQEFNLTVDVAWAWEGLGLYLTREMIGSRLTWYIQPTEESLTSAEHKVNEAWMNKLLTPGMNWMNEGYRLVRSGEVPGLVRSLTKPLNRMTPQDLFVSYVVAAYLLEAEAMRLPSLLRGLVQQKQKPGMKFPDAWERVLAMDVGTFQARLERWLGERR